MKSFTQYLNEGKTWSELKGKNQFGIKFDDTRTGKLRQAYPNKSLIIVDTKTMKSVGYVSDVTDKDVETADGVVVRASQIADGEYVILSMGNISTNIKRIEKYKKTGK